MQEPLSYFAVAARGTEQAVAEELTEIGVKKAEIAHGGVHFEADRETFYQIHLWSRCSTRILRPLRQFAAESSIMVYDQIRRMRWEDWLSAEKTFSVDCTLSQLPPDHRLRNSHFVALKIKDAIVDRLREKQGSRPNVDTAKPDLKINAYIHRQNRGTRCVLSLDATGRSLHERGYRLPDAIAPLRETLAASILRYAGYQGQEPLFDPMCGSGTFVIEAALMAHQIAPNLSRQDFCFKHWPDFDAELFTRVQKQAQHKKEQGLGQKRAVASIFASDQNPVAVKTAKASALKAGVQNQIIFSVQSISSVQPPEGPHGLFLSNPPYGERMGQASDLPALYKDLGDLLKNRFKGWRAAVLCGEPELSKKIGLKTSKRQELFNGAIECRLLQFKLY